MPPIGAKSENCGTRVMTAFAWTWPLVAAWSPLAVWVGMLAGPSLSFLPEGPVLLSLAVGVASGGALMWLVLARTGSGTASGLSPTSWTGRALWLTVAALVGAVGAVWTGQSLSVWGLYLGSHAAAVTVVGVLVVLGLAVLVARAVLRNRAELVVASGLVVLLAWIVIVALFPWSFRDPLTFNRSIAFVCPFCRLPYLTLPAPGFGGIVDVASLGFAAMLLITPWILDTGRPRQAARPLATALVASAMVLGLLVVGTELGSMFYEPGPSLVASVNALTGFIALLVAFGGGTALLLGVAWGRAAGAIPGGPRQAGVILLGIAATLAAGLWLFNWPLSSGRLANADVGALAVSYLIAPWLGVLAVRAVLRHPPASRGSMVLAWAAGLVLSAPAITGWNRWAGGPWLHAVLPGLAVHQALRLDSGGWALARPPSGDGALLAGLLGAAVAYIVIVAVAARASATRTPGAGA